MGACLSLFGLAVACLAFGAATQRMDDRVAAAPATQKEVVKAAALPARFFADRIEVPAAARARVPIEALLLQLETHVRLEQAAAESFLEAPTPVLLHGRTTSPLLN